MDGAISDIEPETPRVAREGRTGDDSEPELQPTWDEHGKFDVAVLARSLGPNMQLDRCDEDKALVLWEGKKMYITYPLKKDYPDRKATLVKDQKAILEKDENTAPEKNKKDTSEKDKKDTPEKDEVATLEKDWKATIEKDKNAAPENDKKDAPEKEKRAMPSRKSRSREWDPVAMPAANNYSQSYHDQASGFSRGSPLNPSLTKSFEVSSSKERACAWCNKQKVRCRTGGRGCTKSDQRHLPPSMQTGNKSYAMDPYERSFTDRIHRRNSSKDLSERDSGEVATPAGQTKVREL